MEICTAIRFHNVAMDFTFDSLRFALFTLAAMQKKKKKQEEIHFASLQIFARLNSHCNIAAVMKWHVWKRKKKTLMIRNPQPMQKRWKKTNGGNNTKDTFIIAWKICKFDFLKWSLRSELYYITLLLFLFFVTFVVFFNIVLSLLFFSDYWEFLYARFPKYQYSGNNAAVFNHGCILLICIVLPTFALVFLSLLIKIDAMFLFYLKTNVTWLHKMLITAASFIIFLFIFITTVNTKISTLFIIVF